MPTVATAEQDTATDPSSAQSASLGKDAVRIEDLHKSFGTLKVLKGVSLTARQGDVVAIIGGSGSGKSTMLRCINFLESPSGGKIIIDGEEVQMRADGTPADRRQIERIRTRLAMVFQSFNLWSHMTVLENVMATKGFQRKGFTGYLFGAARSKAKSEARSILDQVGLSHALLKYPHELSGGMKQRLAIAQALLGKPRILLLDEPFGALDPGIRADMHELVLNLWREHKLTVFMVTHDLKEGFYLGTRLWVFDKLRHDPQAAHLYGAGITYDLPVGEMDTQVYQNIDDNLRPLPACVA